MLEKIENTECKTCEVRDLCKKMLVVEPHDGPISIQFCKLVKQIDLRVKQKKEDDL